MVCIFSGKELQVLLKAHGADGDANTSMMIPYFVAGNHSHAKPLAGPAEACEAGLIFRAQLAPRAGELLYVDTDAEIVLEDLLERSGGAHMAREKSGVVEIGVVGNSAAFAQAFRAQTNQVEETTGEPVFSRFFVFDEEAILLPTSVEERDHAMVEDVEEVFHHMILLAGAGEKELGIGGRHDRDGGAQAHEFDGHRRLAVLKIAQREDLTGRKRQRGARGKANGLTLRRDKIADRLEILFYLLQQAHSLKEVHAEGLFLEHSANSSVRGLWVGLRLLRGYSSA